MLKATRVLLVLAVCIAVGYLMSCKKGSSTEARVTIKGSAATISYSAPVAADGCDYLINIDNTAYHADNLTSEFQVNNLKVIVSATVTGDRFYCGMMANNPGIPVIHITSMVKQ